MSIPFGKPSVAVAAGGAVLGLFLVLSGCGGGGGYSSSPSGTSTNTSTSQGPTVTVNITAAGPQPATVEIPLGGRVTFINGDNKAHQVQSNPHPVHTDCPAVNEVSMLNAGQSRTTGSFDVARACGYHDHMRPDDSSMWGTILVGGAQQDPTHY
jgi:plastocyanin